jgi:hypothetical protein
MKSVFTRIRSSRLVGSELFIANENGHYLVNPDVNKAFGFEFGHSFTLQTDFPELADFIQEETRQKFSSTIALRDGQHMFHFEKVAFNAENGQKNSS